MTPFDLDVADVERPTTVDDLARAINIVAGVLVEGEAKHHGRWRRQSLAEHTDHLLAHVIDGSDLLARGRRDAAVGHFAHAATRALMLLELAAREGDTVAAGCRRDPDEG